jgi:7-dehydrocholesterol reductase
MLLLLLIPHTRVYFRHRSGSTGTAIFDFFWGTELYPRFGHAIWPIGWDIKQFTNCRWGMMFWAIGTMSFAAKQYEVEGKIHDSMFISVLVQFCYVLKFFIWETGYFNTMDIQHDRAGFYICWGCLVWVPSLYTIHSLFLVNHPVNLGAYTAAILGGLGIMGVYVNWEADQQKIDFRESKGAKLIYGKTPVKIVASYTTEKGEIKSSLLLASGWWGVSRHFHYLPELLAAFAWSVPCLWTGNVLGFSYFIFLFFLLADRCVKMAPRQRFDPLFVCISAPFHPPYLFFPGGWLAHLLEAKLIPSRSS